MSDFLKFVDDNSQPNGRQSGSYSAQFFFHPKFSRIAPPREGEKNFSEKVHTSVVSEFNRAQREMGRGTCGPTAASEWLKKHRPKVALHPSMTDYCDTCKHLKEEVSRVQAVMNRLKQSGNANESELRMHENTKHHLEEQIRQHKEAATKSREYYKTCQEKCKTSWSEIVRLTNKSHRTAVEREELESLQHCFTLTISADYQQSKLIPSWGKTEQPSSTYYLQKVSHDVFGIVDHRQDKSTIYLFDERIGPKNTDHTISLMMHYWETVSCEHPWIQRLAIFLDNATSTNKNRFLFAWAMELVSSGMISHVHISFMIAGHTKFAPDWLFATIGSAYKVADVFTINELKSLCTPSATTTIAKGENVLTWRETLAKKYSDLPGVRKFHDFLIVKAHTGQVVMKVREQCFGGQWKDSPLHIVNHTVLGTPFTNYKEHNIKDDKMANMVTMYDKFIPPDRRPEYLPALKQSLSILSSTQSSLTPAEPQTSLTPSSTPRQRKASKCTVNGCNGSGHRNKARWAEGHTTKAGCPIFHVMH